MNRKPRILALTSGGFDSFFMLWKLKTKYTSANNITPLYVHYEHLAEEQEISHLRKQCEYLGLHQPIEIELKNISPYLSNNLTREGQQSTDFYPARNLMMLVNAAQIAYGLGLDYLALGIIKSPREFHDSSRYQLLEIEKTINLAIFGPIIFANDQYSPRIRILIPIADLSKRDLRVLYNQHNLPMDLTYSCQKGGQDACSKCPSCKELEEANDWISV